MTDDAQAVLAREMTERDLSQHVVNLARMLGWKVARWPTWRATGTDPGVPDLLLAKNGREPLFVELKAEAGKLSEPQREWLHALVNALWTCWRPSDWLDGTVERALRG